MNNEEKIRYEIARRRMKTLKQFYIMIAVYFVIGSYMVFKDWKSNGNIFNVDNVQNNWLLILWGIALVVYGITIFHPFFNRWEQKKIKELTKKYSDGITK